MTLSTASNSRLGDEVESVNPIRSRRPSRLVRRLLMFIRRSHLYFGLFLFPWAVLYGVTAYLFNHPTHFNDGKLVAFGAEVLADTELAEPAKADATAEKVLEELHRRFPDTKLSRDESFKPKFDAETVGLAANGKAASYRAFVQINGSGGMARPQDPPKPGSDHHPAFEIVPKPPAPAAASSNAAPAAPVPSTEPLVWKGSLADRATASTQAIFERVGMWQSDCEAKVQSVPNLVFRVRENETLWELKHNSLSGQLTGREVMAGEHNALAWRPFLLRLHTAHGYPGETNAKFWWAIIVDVMAVVLVFWGVSGVVMWWQIKATRRAGALAMLAGVLSAVVLAVGMASYFNG